jgi:hypothetical protein
MYLFDHSCSFFPHGKSTGETWFELMWFVFLGDGTVPGKVVLLMFQRLTVFISSNVGNAAFVPMLCEFKEALFFNI